MLSVRLACVLLLAFSASICAADDDAVWIDRYVNDALRVEAQAAQDAGSLALSQLPQMVGMRVRLFLRGGVERRGTVDSVSNDRVRLKGTLKGGYFTYEVPRQQIVRIEKEGNR